ncbi:hypothetical protein FRC08_001110 [Ceratobasidium sp. 394]|nr:hypothetical protein FRC08_001110 [Ceratobasidium sp. 394]KAG9077380.1 hypothetical protein FS749_010749 [Ceratobasidium sp. UAMH 11750]
MIKQGRGGRIIGASSVWGLKAQPMNVSYNISKFGIRAITQTAALEWGEHNITVNAYAPGLIDTPMVAASSQTKTGQEVVQSMVNGSSLKRIGQPEEIASLVSFIASEGSSYITGQTLSANGGLLMS